MDRKEKWWQSVVAKYGSEEAARLAFREASAKSKRNQAGVGGFGELKQKDPVKFKELSAKGGRNNANTR